jgi:ankyrin repeat protein
VLERKASVNSRGRYGTALRAAALRGHDTVVRLLIDKGARIQDVDDADAMQAAASKGHLSTVKLLLESGHYNVVSFFKSAVNPAVEAACFRGYMDIAKLFLQTYGQRIAFTVFEAALDGGQEKIAQHALNYAPWLRDPERIAEARICGADGSCSLLPDGDRSRSRCRHDKDARCALDEASRNEESHTASSKFDGNLPWLELVKEDNQMQDSFPNAFGTNNNDINKGNGRFLRIAARHGYGDIIERLLAQGLEVNTTRDGHDPSSGQPTPIEVASAAGQMHIVELLLRKGARVGKALSHAVRNQQIQVIRLLLQDFPDTPVDEPVRQHCSGHYSPPCESAVCVAVAWNFPHILDLLVGHARASSSLAVGRGLVEAAKKKDLNLIRLILSAFADSESTPPEHYDALLQVTKQAAHDRDMNVMRLLLDHAVSESTRELLFSEFIREGIIRDWYTVLWDVKADFAPPFYDRLPPKAFLAISAEEQSDHSDENRSDIVGQLQQLCESYPMCVSSYPEALIEAARSGNTEVIHFLLHGTGFRSVLKAWHRRYAHRWKRDILTIGRSQPTGYRTRAQCHKIVPWIDHSDGHGNTALYYACTGGHTGAFRALVDAGADPYTDHLPCPSPFISDTSGRSLDEGRNKVNLLQIALDARMAAERGGSPNGIWKLPLRETWGPIVFYLLDAGLEVDLESPSLVKFFYISCYQCELAYVKKLLAKGISLVGKAGGSNSNDYSFGSALQVAAATGRKDVAKCLLNHGADVRLKADFGNGDSLENQTAVETAIEGYLWFDRSESAVLETCAYLVESGAADSDAEIVLRAACESENMKIVKRMVQHGANIPKIPVKNAEDHVALYRVFSKSGYDLRSQPEFIAEIQVNAVERGDVKLLASLVDRYGLQARFDMVDCASAIIWCEGDRRAVLRYFIDELSFNIDTPHHYWPGSSHRNNLLGGAVERRRVEVVEFLLQEGANPDSPGLRCTPLMVLLRNSIGCSENDSIVRIAKLLLQYGADVHGSRESDREPDGRLKHQFKPPLMFALLWGSSSALEVVKLLIEHGADVNHGAVSPFQLARYFGRPEFESLLLQHGAVDHGDPARFAADYVDELRKESRDIH